MKIKRFFGNIIVLLIFALVVFFVGWVQFSVKPGTCSIMKSKTSGLYSSAIVPGVFTWRWERLLPTNVTLENFDLSVYKSTQTVSGELPSAELYASHFFDSISSGLKSKEIDFSYSVTVTVSMALSPEGILDLVRENTISKSEDLEGFYESKARLIASLVTDYLVSTSSLVNPSSFDRNEILSIVSKKQSEFENIEISEIEIETSQIPDIELYKKAKEGYESYIELLSSKMLQKADEQAELFSEQDRTIVQLEKLGVLMQKYPKLEELFKTGDAAQIMGALRSLK